MNSIQKGLIRYGLATTGLLFVALGVALSIKCNLGTSPLSCPSYILQGTWGLTVGNWVIIVNLSYLIAQMVIFGRKFKAKYLMQIPASFVFGYLIDFCMLCVGGLSPNSLVSKLVLLIVSCFVTAVGVSIEVVAQGWMLSAEMTVYALVKATGKSFGVLKVAMDSLMVVIAAVIAYLMYGNLFGSGEFSGIADLFLGRTQGIVIGLGTLISAVLTGALMELTDPLTDKWLDAIIRRVTG